MIRLSGIVVALVLAWASVSAATTVRPVPDAALAAQADAIVEGDVATIATVRTTAGQIETDVTLGQVTTLAGVVPTPLVLVEPGGDLGPDCGATVCALVIPGTPTYRVGEHVLVFVAQRPDGTLETLDLVLGKYTAEGNTFTRDVEASGATELGATTPPHRDRRDAQAFRAAMRDAGKSKHDLRPIPAPNIVQAHDVAQFAFFNTMRWFAPDRGEPVRYLIDATGDAKLGTAASRAAIDAAFQAWTDVPTATIVLADAGPTSPSGSFCDGVSKIVFNDPNSAVTDPNGCGGVLAIGGYCGGSGTRTVNGTTFREIVEADIVFNNGFSGCSFWNQTNVAEVATHEIGHTIGLAHSTDASATMYSMAHFDGRGASLKPDDVAGVSAIYPAGTSSPVPSTSAAATPAPTTSAAAAVAVTFNKAPASYRHGELVEIHIVVPGAPPHTHATVTLSGPGVSRTFRRPLHVGMAAVRRRVRHTDGAGTYTVRALCDADGRTGSASYTVQGDTP